MPSFTVRVELHHASTKEDYDKLHDAMFAENFFRVIESGDGVWYSLPTAEYEFSGDLTTGQVREAAKKAAATTGKKLAVLVTQSSGRAWSGLEEV